MPNPGGRRAARYGSCNNARPPLVYSSYSSPPPPYDGTSQMPYYRESPDETTSLVSTDRGGKSVKCWIFHHAFPLLFILTMASLWVAAPMASAAVKYEMAEWGRIHGEMVRDIARLRVEKNGISDDLEQLRVERDEQRREWELEREENEKRRRGHVPFWGPPRLLTGQCPKDRIRRYEARMYNLLVEDDWHAACMREHVQIPGRGNVLARTCVNQGLDNGVRGYWSVDVNTRECPRNIWDRLRNIFGW